VTIVSLPTGSKPYGLFVDDTNVYWTNSKTGEVMQAKADGSAQVTLATGEDTPIAVQVRDGYVYWLSYSVASVMRKTPIGGGAVTDLTPAPAARELWIGKDFLFWTREPDDIQRIPATGLADGGTADLLTNNLLSNGLTSDDVNLFWVNRQDGNVKKSDLALGNETMLAVGDVPWDIAVDADNVYWTEQGSAPNSGKVMKASKVDGSGATVLASGQSGPAGIAIDGSKVYWANQTGGTINAVPIAGGAVQVLATGQKKPINVAVDAAHVYWANTTGDTIVRIAK
jgi:sugar lactone lactonase YvrE